MFKAFYFGLLVLLATPVIGSVASKTTGQAQASQGTNLEQWIPIALGVVLLAAVIFIIKVAPSIPKWIYNFRKSIKEKFLRQGFRPITGDPVLDAAIRAAGYDYNPGQDIFYSTLNAWQRDMGYHRLYDEAAAPMGMIIDCEPIYFDYNGKKWLIELWKGQYDLTTGCEVGVYNTVSPAFNISGINKEVFYYSASDDELLKIALYLEKDGEILFTRRDKHWWVTGFVLGEFSEPYELTMQVSITLKDEIMRNAFLKGLNYAGYRREEVIVNGNTVSLRFDRPRTPQPKTRTEDSDRIIQRKNQIMCNMYQDVTKAYTNLPDKINAVKKDAPELYKEIRNIGKSKKLVDAYNEIRKGMG